MCIYIYNSLTFKVLIELSESNDANEALTIEIFNKHSNNIIINFECSFLMDLGSFRWIQLVSHGSVQ